MDGVGFTAGCISIVVFVVLVGLFFGGGESSAESRIAHSCDTFGKVEINKVIYECHKQTP